MRQAARAGRILRRRGCRCSVASGLPNHETAYSVLEALRMAAASVLDMYMEDLQILVIGYVDRDEVDGLLWDPMPGGSGLIDQICERFDEVVTNAVAIVETCPSACETSCVDVFRPSGMDTTTNT